MSKLDVKNLKIHRVKVNASTVFGVPGVEVSFIWTDGPKYRLAALLKKGTEHRGCTTTRLIPFEPPPSLMHGVFMLLCVDGSFANLYPIPLPLALSLFLSLLPLFQSTPPLSPSSSSSEHGNHGWTAKSQNELWWTY